MGLLRLFLAIEVFIKHFAYIKQYDAIISGELAVRIFYLLSGFYIQLIISQYDSQQRWKTKFYLSRLFRLFPTYYLILILAIWFYGTSCNVHCTSMVINNSVGALLFYYLSNLFIFGQDIGKFMVYHFTTGTFSFDSGHPIALYWVRNMNFVAPAWSIAVEMSFYLIAPFILKRRSLDLAAIAAISFFIKIFLIIHGYNNRDNWYNDFFPAEIHTFLLGALATRIACNSDRMRKSGKYLLCIGMAFFSAYLMNRYKVILYDGDELLIISICCFIPFIFQVTKGNRLDRVIGEMSYPLYLNHILVINFLERYISDSSELFHLSILASCMLSIAIVLLIEEPITKFRHRMFRSRHEPIPLAQNNQPDILRASMNLQ